MCAFAPYDLDNVKVIGFDVVVNRPKVAAYRAPGGPIAEFAVEQVIDELAQRLHLDPVELRLKNAAKEGTKAAYGPKFGPIGMVQTLEAARAHPHYRAPLKANQGRGVASGFWFNIGGETCAALNLGEDGTVTLVAGTPDIGGSRASLAMMAAEELGIAVDKVRPIIGDTSALGYNFLTGGSRVTFSSGMAVIEAARDVIRQLCERAAKIWEIEPDEVIWEDGHARCGKLTLSLAEIAKTAGKTGGPIVGNAAINAQGAGPSLATHVVDVEVDPETGKVTIVRYTAIRTRARRCIRATSRDRCKAARCKHRLGAQRGVHLRQGRPPREPGLLDYRIPVCSDVPMIDTVIVEVPNPRHPYGVRGVGGTPIVPPMAAIANAVANATGIRFTALPMSPPRVLEAIDAARASKR
jgi:CO/xanthine dehydrogenase Mo-binding subunit